MVGGVLSIAESYGAASAHRSESCWDRGVVVLVTANAGGVLLIGGGAAADQLGLRGGEGLVGRRSAWCLGAKSDRGEVMVVEDRVSLSESKTARIAHEVFGLAMLGVGHRTGGVVVE